MDRATAAAIRKYRAMHWGEPGKGALRIDVPDPFLRGERPIVLGQLVSVTYRTRKGGADGDYGDLVDYEHDFKKTLPLLAFNRSGLIVCGGSYTIETRGIVG